jgi:hypothetical protein
VFLNFVFFTNLAKDSGLRSQAGVSQRSLESFIFSRVFNLSSTCFFSFLSISILTASIFFFVLYLSNLYLDKTKASTSFIVFFSLHENIVKLFPHNLGNFSHKNSRIFCLPVLLK